jgi:hypothetical protein
LKTPAVDQISADVRELRDDCRRIVLGRRANDIGDRVAGPIGENRPDTGSAQVQTDDVARRVMGSNRKVHCQ